MPRADSPFDKRTLRQRCTTYVRDLIITGRMKPGDHLVETKLSDDLGVSRGTLRESLRPLEMEGLLVSDGRGHMHVRVITADEIREVFGVRTALESYAASLLAARDDREQITDELRRSLDPLRDEDLDFGAQIAADLGFHELMCRLTGNSTLVRSWQQLIGQIEMMIIATGPAIASSRMRYDGHIAIVDAIASGDPDRVRDVVASHMDEFATKYLLDAAAPPT